MHEHLHVSVFFNVFLDYLNYLTALRCICPFSHYNFSLLTSLLLLHSFVDRFSVLFCIALVADRHSDSREIALLLLNCHKLLLN